MGVYLGSAQMKNGNRGTSTCTSLYLARLQIEVLRKNAALLLWAQQVFESSYQLLEILFDSKPLADVFVDGKSIDQELLDAGVFTARGQD